MNTRLPRAQDGRVVLSKDTFNRMAGLIEWLCQLTATPPLMLDENPTGRTLSVARQPDRAVLVRVDATALGGGKYTGRSWLLPRADVLASPDLSADDLGVIDSGAPDTLIENTLEQGGTTHWVPFPCYLVGAWRRTNADGTRVIAVSVPACAALVRIDSVISGASGKYNGTIMVGQLLGSEGGDFVLPGSGFNILTAGASCVVENLDEVNTASDTHWLLVDGTGYAEGVYFGLSSETPPRAVVRIQRGKYRTASPQAIGTSAERTTAAADTWLRDRATSGTDYGDTPIEIWVGTGCYYDDTNVAPALRQHMRKITIAADGRVHSVSAETDYTIDVPDACA